MCGAGTSVTVAAALGKAVRAGGSGSAAGSRVANWAGSRLARRTPNAVSIAVHSICSTQHCSTQHSECSPESPPPMTAMGWLRNMGAAPSHTCAAEQPQQGKWAAAQRAPAALSRQEGSAEFVGLPYLQRHIHRKRHRWHPQPQGDALVPHRPACVATQHETHTGQLQIRSTHRTGRDTLVPEAAVLIRALEGQAAGHGAGGDDHCIRHHFLLVCRQGTKAEGRGS